LSKQALNRPVPGTAAPDCTGVVPFQSLRSKFIRTLLLVMGLTGLATLIIVVVTSAQASSEHLDRVQRYIEQGITSKGRVLTENHARALRGLTLDNAFLDMQRLVERVVQEDSDLIYGLYVNSERETLASSRRGARATPDSSPSKDAWRSLAIHEQDLLVKTETVTHTIRLGEDVWEVAMPVSENGELLGTIRYGLSTRLMREAMAHAKTEAKARLVRSVAWIFSLVILAVLCGLWLSRRQAVRITHPITDLTLAAQALATGDRSVRVKIDSGDEIQILGASFNRMVEDLDASYRQLEGMNRSLERKVEERTVELARKNGDMRLVLDNVEQGFMTLDIEGTVSDDRSRVVDDWFGAATGELKFWDYLGRIDASVAEWFELGWATLRDDILPLALCLEQLPALVRKDGRTFALRYRPIMDGERLHKLIVVITNVTWRIEREHAEQAQREMLSIFRHTISDKPALDDFFTEASTLVDAITLSERADLTVVTRHVHTLKGNCGLFGIESVATFCHEIEDRMIESGEPMRPETKDALRELWTKVKKMRAELTEGGDAHGIELNRGEYASFVTDLRERLSHDLLVATAASWQFEPSAKRLMLLAEQIRRLASRLGRAAVDVICAPTDLRLPPRKWGPFWSVFAHVVRNTVDHGVDTTEARIAAGKPARATVTLSVTREADRVVVSIEDDGRGIDWTKIAERARERGLAHATRADLEQALFVDGFSTRGDVTGTSGRGVGLAAIRGLVVDLGGRIEIRSEHQRGSTFRFLLPDSMLFDDLSAGSFGAWPAVLSARCVPDPGADQIRPSPDEAAALPAGSPTALPRSAIETFVNPSAPLVLELPEHPDPRIRDKADSSSSS
jgi:HPt (histidine-containing phosphotransfer) domain-containing protein/HAMP domain-containing protein